MKTLHLPLKKEWYEMIESLIKPEEVELIPDVKEDNFSKIDWNQVRVQASIGAMQVLIGKNNDHYTYKYIAEQSVGYADALIKELKK